MADLSNKAYKLGSKRFLVVQGTADEVVHQQQSLWLAKSLIQEGVTFRQQVKIEIYQQTYRTFSIQKTKFSFKDIRRRRP